MLTMVWWGWGLLLFLLLIVLSLQPALFGDDTGKVWQWFLPNLVPAMTMVGFTAYASPTPAESTANLFPLALGVSGFYLAVLTLSVAGTLFAPRPLEFLNTSSLWLAPLQGFALAGLGVFFVKK
jgi:hypothetical protein